MERTNLSNYGDVVLTAGGHVAGVGRVFGVFANEADAMAETDETPTHLAIVSARDLTPEQIAIAERNSGV